MALTTEMVKRIIIANHMQTWKYRLRMVSSNAGKRGTLKKNPAMNVYSSKIMLATFHQDGESKDPYWLKVRQK
jgi:hypothetical protein